MLFNRGGVGCMLPSPPWIAKKEINILMKVVLSSSYFKSKKNAFFRWLNIAVFVVHKQPS